jgi:serine/threonine-protein kinase
MNAPVQPGEVLQGKYRVERLLGEGGMGVVVAATHIGFDDRVAIKLIRSEAALQPEVVQRFLREGRAARKIRSEHVVQVMDVGTLESGVPYMVMEFLEGEDLSAWVERAGPMPYGTAVEFILQACEAIAEAHLLGIVHRDLKPANLFAETRRGGTPCIKVLDFGISKVSEPGGPGAALTRTSVAMGSPPYMSPEQLSSSRNVDARSDIWALGVILYELVSGQHPFMAEDLPRLCMQIMLYAPVPLLSRRPDAPAALVAAIDRCLEKDPASRFANVGELVRALEPLINERAQLSSRRIAALYGGALPAGDALVHSDRIGHQATIADNRVRSSPFVPSAQPGARTGTSGAVVMTASNTLASARPNRAPIWIAAGLALVIVAGGAAWLALSSKQSGGLSATSAAPQVVPPASSLAATNTAATATPVPAAPVVSVGAAPPVAAASTPLASDVEPPLAKVGGAPKARPVRVRPSLSASPHAAPPLPAPDSSHPVPTVPTVDDTL